MHNDFSMDSKTFVPDGTIASIMVEVQLICRYND